MSPTYSRALDHIFMNGFDSIDIERVAELFSRLIDAGKASNEPTDRISDYLKNKGMTDGAAHDVKVVYRVVHTLKKRTSHYSDAFIQSL